MKPTSVLAPGRAPSGLQVERRRPPELTDLDELLFEGRLAPKEDDATTERRVVWLRAAALHHLEANPYYRRLASAQGVTAADVAGMDDGDLHRLPLVSSGAFKSRRLSEAAGPGVKLCLSSGTGGNQSVVPRDDRTLERLLGTVTFGVRSLLGDRERRRLLVLGPPTDEAGDLWFSYVLSLGRLINDTSFFVHDDVLDLGAAIEALASAADGTQQLLVGPPALVADLLDTVERAGVALGLGDGFVLTAGGWKKRADERVDRDAFEARLASTLSVPRDRCRDAFNMVELNTVVFECEAGVKHIPPWLEVVVRRPRDMSVAGDGETGVLTYLDPTPLSYPGFVFSDDLGHVTRGVCACGRGGRFMTIERRVAGIEERGCALKMQRYADG